MDEPICRMLHQKNVENQLVMVGTALVLHSLFFGSYVAVDTMDCGHCGHWGHYGHYGHYGHETIGHWEKDDQKIQDEDDRETGPVVGQESRTGHLCPSDCIAVENVVVMETSLMKVMMNGKNLMTFLIDYFQLTVFN